MTFPGESLLDFPSGGASPCGQWILHKEERVKFWSYPVKRTRFSKKLVVQSSTVRQAFSGRHRTYWIDRTWYSTVTREFFRDRDVVRTFEQETAEGYAVFDWVNKTHHMPACATSEVGS